MNIKRAKEEIKDTIEAYLLKDEYGAYEIPSVRQRPVLLIGPPGVGKTQIMEQISRECEIGLVAYTITHHTRQRGNARLCQRHPAPHPPVIPFPASVFVHPARNIILPKQKNKKGEITFFLSLRA